MAQRRASTRTRCPRWPPWGVGSRRMGGIQTELGLKVGLRVDSRLARHENDQSVRGDCRRGVGRPLAVEKKTPAIVVKRAQSFRREACWSRGTGGRLALWSVLRCSYTCTCRRTCVVRLAMRTRGEGSADMSVERVSPESVEPTMGAPDSTG